MQRAPAHVRQRGFTLIEILIAVSIFAMIGIASAQMLTRVVSADAVMTVRAERLFQLQRGMAVLDRDLSQLVVRGVRDQFGDERPPLSGDEAGGFEFTRRGWANPLGQPRSGLQRVAYSFDGERLLRQYWTVLDRAEDSDPLEQVMLEDVVGFSVAFVDEEGNRTSSWPPDRVPLPGSPVPGGADGEGAAVMPLALEVTVDAAPFGAFSRLWLMPREHVASNDQTNADEDEDQDEPGDDADEDDDESNNDQRGNGGRGTFDTDEES